jgi:hypothetical protein
MSLPGKATKASTATNGAPNAPDFGMKNLTTK